LPGGASQIQETFDDWRVTCASPNGTKICTLSQQLADPNTRQLVVGIELKAQTPDKTEGTLVLPFGLAVDKPVMLQIDEGGAPMTHKVRTCLPVGCVVSLTFDTSLVTSLRKGTILNVKGDGRRRRRGGVQDLAARLLRRARFGRPRSASEVSSDCASTEQLVLPSGHRFITNAHSMSPAPTIRYCWPSIS
jgi:hypothetical protein